MEEDFFYEDKNKEENFSEEEEVLRGLEQKEDLEEKEEEVIEEEKEKSFFQEPPLFEETESPLEFSEFFREKGDDLFSKVDLEKFEETEEELEVEETEKEEDRFTGLGEEKKQEDSFENLDQKKEEQSDSFLISASNDYQAQKFSSERIEEFEEKQKGLRAKEAVYLVETSKIKPNPYQPRRQFSEEDIKELALSIKEYGILQPLIVSKVEKDTSYGKEIEYQLIAGERRLLAARMIGLERVPVIIKEVSQEKAKLEMAIIENLQRQNLNPMETARAFARLADEFKMSQREIAVRVGRSRESIANTLRLLSLSEKAQKALEDGLISESHARIILSFNNPQHQDRLLEEVIKYQLSVREAQERARQIARSILDTDFLERKAARKKGKEKKVLDPIFQETARYLEEYFSTPVEILPRGKDGGKIQIRFFDREQLREIIEKIVSKGEKSYNKEGEVNKEEETYDKENDHLQNSQKDENSQEFLQLSLGEEKLREEESLDGKNNLNFEKEKEIF